MPTFDTRVSGLEVGDEVLAARLLVEEVRVRDADAARLLARAPLVHVTQDVRRASDVVVRDEAAAQRHPAVVRRLHQDHLAFRARGVEGLPLAVLLHTIAATGACNGQTRASGSVQNLNFMSILSAINKFEGTVFGATSLQ
jgi:hypothetical protein